MGRIIAIGDIHGCRPALEAIIDAITPTEDDELVLLGDYIDRGPDSWGVIQLLLKLQYICKFVALLGNHEEMLLSSFADRPSLRFWLGFGGDATLESYRLGREGLPAMTYDDMPFRKWLWMPEESARELRRFPVPHLAFLRECVSYYETHRHIFVHGNCRPDAEPAQESEQILRWEAVDPRWSQPHCSGKTLIVGHSAQKDGQILDLGFLKCIDTYCHGGGWLTALDVTSGQVWQASREGRLRNLPRR